MGTRIAVIFGGQSSEHSISCISAGHVMAALDPAEYEILDIGITPTGAWVQAGEFVTVDGLPRVSDERPNVAMSLDPSRPGFLVDGSHVDVDVVFPVLHGPWGEDGTIQGILEFAGIPYVGSGVFASAAAMDKAHMKALFTAAELPVGEYEVITDRQWREDQSNALSRVSRLGAPVFVKPSRAGSSIGISKVNDRSGLVEAIEFAREADPKVIVEAAAVGSREIECGVLVDADGHPQASVCAEIVVRSGHEFYDFEAKYLDDSADLYVPAELDEATSDQVRALAVRAFEALDCEGLARVDFFVGQDGGIIINEINTMPGFTDISMFPRMWQAMGVSYPELVDRLVRDALRHGVGLR